MQMDTLTFFAVEIVYKQHCSLHSVADEANKGEVCSCAVTRSGHICAVPFGPLSDEDFSISVYIALNAELEGM
jgi:hypothetical protein